NNGAAFAAQFLREVIAPWPAERHHRAAAPLGKPDRVGRASRMPGLNRDDKFRQAGLQTVALDKVPLLVLLAWQVLCYHSPLGSYDLLAHISGCRREY